MVIIVWLYCFHIYKCALDVAELRSLSSPLSGVGVTWSGRLAGASGTSKHPQAEVGSVCVPGKPVAGTVGLHVFIQPVLDRQGALTI